MQFLWIEVVNESRMDQKRFVWSSFSRLRVYRISRNLLSKWLGKSRSNRQFSSFSATHAGLGYYAWFPRQIRLTRTTNGNGHATVLRAVKMFCFPKTILRTLRVPSINIPMHKGFISFAIGKNETGSEQKVILIGRMAMLDFKHRFKETRVLINRMGIILA